MSIVRILMVEDDRIVAADIQSRIQGLGYEVMASVAKGEDALAIIKKEAPDLILMDIRLKGQLNGIETTDLINKENDIPVVYVTAYADNDTLQRAKKTAPYGYLIKPIRDDALKSAIEVALYKHRMERKLKESEEWLQTTLSSIGDGVIATDLSGHIQFMNPVAESLTGWPLTECSGKHLNEIFRIINESTRQPVENPVDKVLVTGQIVGLANHTLLVARDGREFPIKDSGSPIRINGGGMLGVVLVFQDDTQARKAEAKLQQSKDQLQSLFNHMFNGFAFHKIITDKSGNPIDYIFLDVNPAYERITGLLEKDIIGKRVTEVLKGIENMDFDWIGTYGNVALSGVAKIFEQYFGPHKRWYRISAYSPQKGYFAVTLEDITERKYAQEDLLRSEAKYRAMMESITDPIYICAPDFTVEYINPAMYRRLGRDVTGEPCYTAMHGVGDKCQWCVFDHLVKGESIETNFVSPLDNRSYRVTNMPVQNEDGTVSKMSIYRDITDYLTAVAEKKEANAKLIQSQKMESIGNLAGGIAHDFNNILSSIIGFTELTMDEVEKNSILYDNLQEIYTAGNRAKDLVKQILVFARQSDEELRPIQVDAIAREVLKFIRSSIPATIEIKQDINSDSLIMGNATQVHQIFMNLCTNAAQAMENDGGILGVGLNDVTINRDSPVSVTGLRTGNYIEISVSDTGVGIPEEIIGSVFEPYFTTKKPGEGTGMGLAMVHGIVESYKGKVLVESKPGKGTLFTIYLPVTRKRGEYHSYDPKILPSGTERILFVDDEAPIARMGSQILKQLGYSVTIHTSGIEALELFRNHPDNFDLVITDMTMPKITGDRLAEEMIAIRPDIPVILCTGYSRKISAEKASEIGIISFVNKPVSRQALAETVRKALDNTKS